MGVTGSLDGRAHLVDRCCVVAARTPVVVLRDMKTGRLGLQHPMPTNLRKDWMLDSNEVPKTQDKWEGLSCR